MVDIKQSPAQSRSAHAAIKGYEYQFDRTALELLTVSASAVVHIEGIEDIDVYDADVAQATQVKYYEAQRYASPKSLREPLALMLTHFRTGAQLNYVLHVHFGDPGELPDLFTVEQVKICLTRHDQTSGLDVEYFVGLDDASLQDFCDRVSIRGGDSFDDQQKNLVQELMTVLGCSQDEVLAIYLAKVRDFVHERARNADSAARRVSRADLINFLSVRELLFSRWQLAALGRERYIRIQMTHLKRNGFTDTKKIRGLSVALTNENFVTVLEIAKAVASTHLGRLKSAKPWVIILGGPLDLVHAFKVELVRNSQEFNDGHESIEFSTYAFSKPPVVNLVGVSDKLKMSSYVLRVISEVNFLSFLAQSSKLGRLVVIGEKESWHDGAADDLYVLKEYEPGILQALMGAVA